MSEMAFAMNRRTIAGNRCISALVRFLFRLDFALSAVQSSLMSEAVDADDVLAVITEHRRCEIGMAGQRKRKETNGSESGAS